MLAYDIKKTAMRLSDLHVADYNARVSIHSDPVFYERLYNSIVKFKYIDPIIVNVKDGKNVIVGGNQRYVILCDMAEDAKLKLEDVMVDVVEVEYDEPTEMAANIALNRIDGDFIQNKLKEDLEYIRGMDEELAVAAGFSIEELDEMLKVDVEEETPAANKFTIHISLPVEYKGIYEIYESLNGEDKLKEEVKKIISQ